TAPFNAVALTPDAISFSPRSPATSWKSRALLNPFTRSLLVEDRQQRASHGIGRSASTCSFHRLTNETTDRGLLAALVIRNHRRVGVDSCLCCLADGIGVVHRQQVEPLGRLAGKFAFLQLGEDVLGDPGGHLLRLDR